MKLSKSAKHAILIGTLCSVSYFTVYIARNVLGAVTPQMMEAGFAEAYIGRASSLFFATYAIGQLINGILGDKIKSKWMICMGLLGACIMTVLFCNTIGLWSGALIFYGGMGFFLSMIYGPMTKVAAENTEPLHATRCAIGYDLASQVGAPTAGLLAVFLSWKNAFYAGSGGMAFMAVVAFLGFTALERKQIIRYGRFKAEKSGTRNLKLLLKNQIVKYSLVSILTGVVRTSVVFWLPTYLNQHIGFSSQTAAGIFTGISLVMSLTTVLAIVVYEKLHHNMDKAVLLFFCCSAGMFLLTYFVRLPVINIVCIVLAIMSSNAAACILWSRYCPSLRDTGMVSSATGYLDFLSYMAAALANLVFANAVEAVGWENLILIWMGLMVLGVIIALPYRKR